MTLACDDVAADLDAIAEKIRFAPDYYSREAAIAEFRRVCRENPEGLNPALEALNRSVALMNPLRV